MPSDSDKNRPRRRDPKGGTTSGVKLWPWLTTAVMGTAAYAAFYEANNLTPERRTLCLPRWPSDLDGFKIGLLADLHIRDKQTIVLTRASVAWLLEQQPDVILIAGDIAQNNPPNLLDMIEFALRELGASKIPAFAVSGNHDYEFGLTPEQMVPALESSGVRLLTNESTEVAGVQIVGIASANAGEADPERALDRIDLQRPTVVLWHEPDMVDELSVTADLMLAGHSHGGQFGLPNGWTPVKTSNGRKYYRGWYPNAPTPLYVSRGIATTFLPMRLFCPPEVTLLTIRRA